MSKYGNETYLTLDIVANFLLELTYYISSFLTPTSKELALTKPLRENLTTNGSVLNPCIPSCISFDFVSPF